MKTLLALSLAGACSAVAAQVPATNPMPDGSRDTYVGLGFVAAPDYLGAGERKLALLPLIQLEASNGVFISGLSGGMHLSATPGWEFGPLFALDRGRNGSGDRHGAGGIGEPVQGYGVRPGETTLIAADSRAARMAPNGLEGIPDIKPRLLGGAFANAYLTPEVRLTATVLYGAGNDHDGLAATLGIQHLATEIAPHHKVTLSAGVTIVNRSHNQAYFGVTAAQADASGYLPYAARGGIRDAYVGAGWNWALSPSWVVSSSTRLSVLKGEARHSPLVKRSAGFTVSTGLAYRF